MLKTKKETVIGFSGERIAKTTKTVRYLTDEEYFNVSVALGNFNKEYFEKNEAKMVALVKADKALARKEFKRVFTAVKKRAIEAVAEGKDTDAEILSYVKRTWEGKGKRRTTVTEISEE